MLSLSVVDIKGFMAKLLKEEIFDQFDLHTLNIQSFVSFEIYKTQDEEIAAKWGDIKPYAFDFIKGGKMPRSVKVVLSLGSGFMNIYFEEGKVTITTGFAQKAFTMDKSQAKEWEQYVLDFLKSSKVEHINEMEAF